MPDLPTIMKTLTIIASLICTLALQANIVECSEDGKPFDGPDNVPDIHYLEAENGMLYFK